MAILGLLWSKSLSKKSVIIVRAFDQLGMKSLVYACFKTGVAKIVVTGNLLISDGFYFYENQATNFLFPGTKTGKKVRKSELFLYEQVT